MMSAKGNLKGHVNCEICQDPVSSFVLTRMRVHSTIHLGKNPGQNPGAVIAQGRLAPAQIAHQCPACLPGNAFSFFLSF